MATTELVLRNKRSPQDTTRERLRAARDPHGQREKKEMTGAGIEEDHPHRPEQDTEPCMFSPALQMQVQLYTTCFQNDETRATEKPKFY